MQGLLGATLLMTLVAGNSQAVTLGFSPAVQNVVAGAPADVAITISGLGDGTPPSLSTFDLVIDFDPAVLSYRDLLLVFFTIHDPTTPDRQGYDVGTQYRSVIFCLTPEQRQTAAAVVAELEAAKLWKGPIVTEIAGPAPFYVAEGYHQEYFSRNGGQPYCEAVVAPKVAKFRKQWSERLKRKAGAR
jgi:hypothetical protein